MNWNERVASALDSIAARLASTLTALANVANIPTSPAKQDPALLGWKDISVPTTAGGTLLSALLTAASITIAAGTKKIILVPRGTIYMSNLNGNATVGSGDVTANDAFPMACTTGNVPAVKLIASGSAVLVGVKQEG